MNKRHFSQVGRALHDEVVHRVIPLMIAQTYNWTLISNCLPGTGPGTGTLIGNVRSASWILFILTLQLVVR